MNLSFFKYSLLQVLTISFLSAPLLVFAHPEHVKPIAKQEKLTMLENSFGGRVGIYAINLANNQRIEYRAEERFPLESTFKVIEVSAILSKSMQNSHLLQQKIIYTKKDLVFWSPESEKHITDGMTISELCAATMMYSDNTAANLLMKKLGGPQAVTAYARSMGDKTFRIDGWEPKLNSNPLDLHDTSTPTAMGKSLQQSIFGNILGLSQREQLINWMKGNTTGETRIRAGVPKGWIVADKTGSGSYGISNDIGIIWPPKCSPIIVAIYTVHNKKDATGRDDIIASVTRLLLNEFAKKDQCIKLKS